MSFALSVGTDTAAKDSKTASAAQAVADPNRQVRIDDARNIYNALVSKINALLSQRQAIANNFCAVLNKRYGGYQTPFSFNWAINNRTKWSEEYYDRFNNYQRKHPPTLKIAEHGYNCDDDEDHSSRYIDSKEFSCGKDDGPLEDIINKWFAFNAPMQRIDALRAEFEPWVKEIQSNYYSAVEKIINFLNRCESDKNLYGNSANTELNALVSHLLSMYREDFEKAALTEKPPVAEEETTTAVHPIASQSGNVITADAKASAASVAATEAMTAASATASAVKSSAVSSAPVQQHK